MNRRDFLAQDSWLSTYCSLVRRGLDGADALIAHTRAMREDLRAHRAFNAHTRAIPMKELCLL